MRKTLLLKKIHLQSFIGMLLSLYDDGIDFVDIEGRPNIMQDHLVIHVKEDYFCSEEEMEYEDEQQPSYKRLSQEDIDKLIN